MFFSKQKKELANAILVLNSEREQVEKNIAAAQATLNDLKDKIFSAKEELGILDGFGYLEDIGMPYEPLGISPSDIERRLNFAKSKLAKLVTNKQAIIINRQYKVNNSVDKGEQFQKTYADNLLMGFNIDFNKKLKAVTSDNYAKSVELIEAKFLKLNKKAEILDICISPKYLALCLEILQLTLEKKNAKAEEAERIRQERNALKEQEKLLAEAEKAKAALQKERRMYEQSLEKALSEEDRKAFEEKLKEIDKREADVDYRINNARAGYLYIARSKAMPKWCKIGVTRRLNPLVRIQELSSASVPFPFVCYGVVFSNDAFELEKKIHEHLDSKRINKNNRHKEFFAISPDEVVKILQKEFGCEVHFTSEGDNE